MTHTHTFIIYTLRRCTHPLYTVRHHGQGLHPLRDQIFQWRAVRFQMLTSMVSSNSLRPPIRRTAAAFFTDAAMELAPDWAALALFWATSLADSAALAELVRSASQALSARSLTFRWFSSEKALEARSRVYSAALAARSRVYSAAVDTFSPVDFAKALTCGLISSTFLSVAILAFFAASAAC